MTAGSARSIRPGTAKKTLLAAYAKQFSTTEINASFYRVPTERAVAAWRDNVPEGFVFAWKASRYITLFKADAMKAATRRGLWRSGPTGLSTGSAQGARCSVISTMTSRAAAPFDAARLIELVTQRGASLA